jgi:hypothetical protein
MSFFNSAILSTQPICLIKMCIEHYESLSKDDLSSAQLDTKSQVHSLCPLFSAMIGECYGSYPGALIAPAKIPNNYDRTRVLSWLGGWDR